MARGAKAVSKLAHNSAFDSGAAGVYTTIDPTNGHALTAAGNERAGTVILHVKNTTASQKKVTVKENGHAPGGDLIVAIPASSERMILLRDDASFEQSGGDFWVDFEAGMTGTFACYVLP